MRNGKNGEYDGFTDYLDTMNRFAKAISSSTIALGITILFMATMYYLGFFSHEITLEKLDSNFTIMMCGLLFCVWIIFMILYRLNERFKETRAIRRILTEKMDGFEEYLEDERYWKNVWERRGKE